MHLIDIKIYLQEFGLSLYRSLFIFYVMRLVDNILPLHLQMVSDLLVSDGSLVCSCQAVMFPLRI